MGIDHYTFGMNDLGKGLVVVGLGVAALGGLLWFAASANFPLGRLPGDIRIEREDFKLYFPLTTCVLMSALVTLLSWLYHKF